MFRFIERTSLKDRTVPLEPFLRKRDNFRRAFSKFDYHRVAEFGPRDVERLLQDAGIVRHRKKIESTINNAGRAVEVAARLGLGLESRRNYWR